jgi:hypothetical protein
VSGSGKHMSKVEIERSPLVGGVLIAVSAAIAIALNTYSSYRAAPAATAVQSLASKDEVVCCDPAQCSPGESHAKACASDVKIDTK